MNAQNKVWEIVDHYLINEENTRQVGKTTVLKEAAKKIDALFLCHNEANARYHGGISMYDTEKLIGSTKPIIFDHYALDMLFRELRGSFNYLQHRYAVLEHRYRVKNNPQAYIRMMFNNVRDNKL